MILDLKNSTAWQLTRMVDLLSCCIPAVIPAPLYYQNFQRITNEEVSKIGYKQSMTEIQRCDKNSFGGQHFIMGTSQ